MAGVVGRRLARVRDRRDLREARGIGRRTDAVIHGADASPMGRFTPEEVEQLGRAGHALEMPDGSFAYPILNGQDLTNALTCYLQAEGGKPPGLHAWIVKRANVLRLQHLLPAGWAEPVKRPGPNEPADAEP